MTRKGIISFVLVAIVVGIGVAILFGERCDKGKEQKTESPVESTTESAVENIVEKAVEPKKVRVNAKELHKDILRMIAAEKEPICGISQEDAEKELEKRSGNEPEIDSKPVDIKKLPFDIVKLIAKSPATIAGIKPKSAINELVRRYLSIKDSSDVNSAVLLEALQHRGEKKAIENWAKNEDAEAVAAFMKEEADKDPSSIANFAYGLKKLDSDHKLAMSYMERYANHAQGDAFDTPDEEKAFNELIGAVKKLK